VNGNLRQEVSTRDARVTELLATGRKLRQKHRVLLEQHKEIVKALISLIPADTKRTGT